MPIRLESLQTQLSKKGNDWVAAETSFSALSADDQKRSLGLDVSEDEIQATEKAIKAVESLQSKLSSKFAESFSAPAAIDWRNNGGDYTTSVKDQASCGSCVSFATIATIESRMNIACRNPNLDPNYSEAFLFYCGCGNCCPSGWNFPPALDFCKNTGVALDSAFPYTPGNQPCKAGVTPSFKITSWASVLSIADRKNVIATKGPVVAGMEVFEDFSYYHTGVYKHTSGASRGYHAVSVVGYDDNLQCWIVKNSWGPGWGDNGFFKIAYGQCKIDTSFAFYDVTLTCLPPTPTTNCTQYVPSLRQVLILAQTNLALKRCLRYYVCRRPGIPPFCTTQHLNVVRAVNKILTLCPQYRKPFCDALG
jgi:C1A family cysteine protease